MIHVISLLRTPERRESFTHLNPTIDFEFSDAVDGDPGLLPFPEAYTLGARGCALSHLRLWQKAVETNQPITIAEDDAILRADFDTRAPQVLAALEPEWDLVMWSWNMDALLSLATLPGITPMLVYCDQNAMRRTIGEFRETCDRLTVLALDKCFGTCCYSISPGGARKFMEGCFPIRGEPVVFPGIAQPIPEDGIDKSMNRLYPVTRSYVAMPPMAVTPNDNYNSLTLRR
jgi:glycosyl transferase family 25